MTTFGVMKSRIADDLVRDDLSTQISNAIQDALRVWEGQRFDFNERRYRINTVASQEYYDVIAPTLLTSAGAAVPTGEKVLEIDSITVTVSNAPYPLCPRTQQWFDKFQALPTLYRGQPDSYAIFGDQLRLFPVPDAAYQLNLSALARLGTLSADADTNAWMTEGEALIRNQAKLVLYRDVLRDNEGKSNAGEAISEAEWALKRKMAGKAYTGRQPHVSL